MALCVNRASLGDKFDSPALYVLSNSGLLCVRKYLPSMCLVKLTWLKALTFFFSSLCFFPICFEVPGPRG